MSCDTIGAAGATRASSQLYATAIAILNDRLRVLEILRQCDQPIDALVVPAIMNGWNTTAFNRARLRRRQCEALLAEAHQRRRSQRFDILLNEARHLGIGREVIEIIRQRRIVLDLPDAPRNRQKLTTTPHD